MLLFTKCNVDDIINTCLGGTPFTPRTPIYKEKGLLIKVNGERGNLFFIAKILTYAI